MGAGAVVAIAAAARQKRIQDTIDAFRLADATSPDRARNVEALGIMHFEEANELAAKGILAPGRTDGTFYLNEAAYIAMRDDPRPRRIAAVMVAVVLIIVGLTLAFVLVARQ